MSEPMTPPIPSHQLEQMEAPIRKSHARKHRSDRSRSRGYKRNRSRSHSIRPRMCRKRSRSPPRHKRDRRRRDRRRHYDSNSASSSSSAEYSSRKRRQVSSDTTESSSFSSSSFSSSTDDDGHRRRSRSKRRCNSRKKRRYDRSSHKEEDRSMMDKFIDALSRHDKNSFNSAHDVIPKFDPSLKTQSTRAWLKKVNEIASIYRWNEKQTIFHALSKLSGLAKQWYEGLLTVDLNWKGWQRKLLKNFPDDRNYAERLTEMLNRKSRRDETLEEYFYDKAKLVSHCNIRGKDAVDCIIYGIYDHNIRLNAQGANFRSPNKLLRFLRSISLNNSKDNLRRPLIPQKPEQTSSRTFENNKTQRAGNQSRIVRCYNCSEIGHTVIKCPKELQKRCTKCNFLGHTADHCRRGNDPGGRAKNVTNSDITPAVNKIQPNEVQEPNPNIYNKVVKVNGINRRAFIDFGSQCTMINKTSCSELNLELVSSKLPILKGFAFGTMQPEGCVQIRICVDFVEADIEAYVVPDEFLNYDLLLGQNLTERPEVVAHKTNTNLVLYTNDSDLGKVQLYNKSNVRFQGVHTVDFICEDHFTGYVYIHGNSCFKDGEEFMLIPGVYSVVNGLGKMVVVTFSNIAIKLSEGKLLARARILPMDIPKVELPLEREVNLVDSNNLENSTYVREEITIDMLNIGPDLSDKDKQELLSMVNEFRDCFALTMDELGKTSICEMHIKLLDDSPVSYKPYRLPYCERIIVRDLINQLLENNIIRESDSPYASPIVLVRKKNGETRLCIDYRALNKKTVKDSYPMPVIDDQLDRLSGKRYFTSLDLKSGYYQIPMSVESRHLTAFVTPDGHYEYTRMPFGLVNAPAVFQHMMNKALGKDRYELAMPYLDDLLSPAATVTEGLKKLRKIFGSLREAGLTLNLNKCSFFATSLDYLGFELSETGLRPGTKKIEAVALFPVPTNVHQVRQFIGLTSFFRRFVPNFAGIAKPLTALTKANVPWVWRESENNAFESLKAMLVQRPILALYDPKYITEVHCDASKIGLGGILLQKPDESSSLKPVAYYSKQTTKEEEYLHSYELETLAVVQSLKKFRVYLIGLPFKVCTDCNALKSTLTKRDLVPRIARWWLLLQEYNFTIEYRPGDNMRHADALSRNPLPSTSHDFDDLNDMREFDILRVDTLDTTQWLHTVQMTDPKLKLIKTVLSQNNKDLKDICNNYVMKDDKLYRKIGDSLKWVVPSAARWRICQLCHDESGHFAVEKTLDRIKQEYWFPKMNRFVNKYVSACLNCAFSKGTTSKKSGYLHPIPKGSLPFHTLHMDHLGPFVRSKAGNSYIFAIIDGFSKFIFVRAVKNLKSNTTIKILQDIFDVVGCPRVIISDRGTSFTSRTFREYIKSIGVKHVLNAVATPRANGQIERYNRTILDSLNASNHGLDEREWDLHVGKVQWSLNNTTNKGTGTSPSEIVFGRRTTSTSEGMIRNALHEDEDPSEIDLEEIRGKAKECIEKSQLYMKNNYDKNRAPTKFYNEGDLVMIPNHCIPADGKSKKLVQKYRGPFKVTSVLPNDRYEVTSIPGFTKRRYQSIYPADQLKKWITFNTHDNMNNDIDESTDNSSSCSNENDNLE